MKSNGLKFLLFAGAAALFTAIPMVLTSSPPESMSMSSKVMSQIATFVLVAILASPIALVWVFAFGKIDLIGLKRPNLDVVLGAVAGAMLYVATLSGDSESASEWIRPMLCFMFGFGASAWLYWRKSGPLHRAGGA